ncbi:MAG: SWIB/MDM2 domain-containing protein [Bacteroidetes bacterium OLB10]|nr:MAG: SWIB/MDM2 domain-containing protein [Bacteroidetes bacterium OLB10]
MKAMTIGEALHPIVGSKPLPRTEVVKKLWEYIKKNKLQDPKEKRNINADDNLKKVFNGKKTVSMFEMTNSLANTFLKISVRKNTGKIRENFPRYFFVLFVNAMKIILPHSKQILKKHGHFTVVLNCR